MSINDGSLTDRDRCVPCPTCGAAIGADCIPMTDDQGPTSIGRWIHVPRWSAAQNAQAQADAALLAAARCFPPGFVEAVAAVLVEGARVKGCEPWESGGGQSLVDHLEHLCGHADRAHLDATHGTTGVDETDLTHAAARAALAYVMRAK